MTRLLALVVLLLAACDGDAIDETPTRCEEVAEWQCRCDAPGYETQAEHCRAHTLGLCVAYPDLPEWSDACRESMDALECPLRGPVDAACAHAEVTP